MSYVICHVSLSTSVTRNLQRPSTHKEGLCELTLLKVAMRRRTFCPDRFVLVYSVFFGQFDSMTCPRRLRWASQARLSHYGSSIYLGVSPQFSGIRVHTWGLRNLDWFQSWRVHTNRTYSGPSTPTVKPAQSSIGSSRIVHLWRVENGWHQTLSSAASAVHHLMPHLLLRWLYIWVC